MPDKVTAAAVRQFYEDGMRWVVLHRQMAGEHVAGYTCWCEPLFLKDEQLLIAHRPLQMMLDEFYAVH